MNVGWTVALILGYAAAYWWGYTDGKRSVARAVGKFVSEATRDKYKGLRFNSDEHRWERRDRDQG